MLRFFRFVNKHFTKYYIICFLKKYVESSAKKPKLSAWLCLKTVTLFQDVIFRFLVENIRHACSYNSPGSFDQPAFTLQSFFSVPTIGIRPLKEGPSKKGSIKRPRSSIFLYSKYGKIWSFLVSSSGYQRTTHRNTFLYTASMRYHTQKELNCDGRG